MQMSDHCQILTADWPVANCIQAGTTLRGLQAAPQHGLAGANMALHVPDQHERVLARRQQLQQTMGWTQNVVWLRQEHTSRVLNLDRPYSTDAAYDAAFSHRAGPICCVMTADCLPILLCHPDGGAIAAIHAGWRGLAAGIIQRTVTQLEAPNWQLHAWLGPAISQTAYQVDEQFYKHFIKLNSSFQTAFIPSQRPKHFQADLYQLARINLMELGIDTTHIHGGKWCTFKQDKSFFSFRRDGNKSGRMASFISLLNP